jgi:succinate dehydrogenase / fumarate reductase cytochrome b subunit
VTATREAAPPLTPDISVRPVNKRPRRRPYPLDIYSTAVGKKWVMALTGIMLMGFVFAHMIGNLKMFLGPEELNHYGEFLRELLVPILPRTVALWLLRLGLIAAFGLHIHAAATLTIMNKKARTVGYQSSRDYVAATFAARTMRVTGIIFALFLVWHLADLTWGLHSINPDFVRGEPYENLSYSLGRPLVAGIYILGNLALGVHLYHGAWSLFQSLGVNNPKFNVLRKRFAQGFVVVTIGANLMFPIAVLTGVVGK